MHLDVRITTLVNVYSYPGRPVIVVVYAGEVTGGTLRGGDEALEVGVFPPVAIPWDDLAFRSTSEALRAFLSGEGRRV